MDTPARVAAREHQRIAATRRGRILVGRQLLSHLEVELLIQVELHPPRKRRVGLLVLDVLRERRDGVVGPDLRRRPDRYRAASNPRETRPATLFERFPVDALEVARLFDERPRHLLVVGRPERAILREAVVEIRERPLVSMAVPVARDTPLLRAFLQRHRQTRQDLPVRFRLVVRGRLLARVDERHERSHPLVLGALVPGGDRQDIVGVEGGRGHAPVERHHVVQLGPEFLEHQRIGAHPAQRVAPVHEHHPRVVAGLGPHVLPTLGQRFLEHLANRALQVGIPFLERLARLEQSPVHVPEDRPRAAEAAPRREHPSAALVDDHLVGVACDAEAHVVDEGLADDQETLRYWERRKRELFQAVLRQEGKADEPASLLAVLPRQREDQRLCPLDQVAVIILAEVARRNGARCLRPRDAPREIPNE